MNKTNCGFRLLSNSSFNALWYHETGQDVPEAKEVILNSTKESFGLHLWNSYTKKRKFDIKNDGAMATFAKNSCPLIHSMCDTI